MFLNSLLLWLITKVLWSGATSICDGFIQLTNNCCDSIQHNIQWTIIVCDSIHKNIQFNSKGSIEIGWIWWWRHHCSPVGPHLDISQLFCLHFLSGLQFLYFRLLFKWFPSIFLLLGSPFYRSKSLRFPLRELDLPSWTKICKIDMQFLRIYADS